MLVMKKIKIEMKRMFWTLQCRSSKDHISGNNLIKRIVGRRTGNPNSNQTKGDKSQELAINPQIIYRFPGNQK